MVPKLICILLCLALLLGLSGCARTSSVSFVQPINISPADPEQPEGTAPADSPEPKGEGQRSQVSPAPADARQTSELPGFAAAFAASRLVVLSAFDAALQRQEQSGPETMPSPGGMQDALYSRRDDSQGVPATTGSEPGLYSLTPDTAPLLPGQLPQDAVAMEDALCCRLDGGQIRISLGTDSIGLISPPQSIMDVPCQPQKLLLENNTLAVLLAREDLRLAVLFYDLSDPYAPVLTGSCGLDGTLVQARLQAGVLVLCTRFSPESSALRLPVYYEGTRSRELQADQILMPESLEDPSFLVCARFDARSGGSLDCMAAAGASDEAGILEDGSLALFWSGAETKQEVSTQSVYTVTTTTSQTQSGFALVRPEDGHWSLGAACRLKGIPQLIGRDENGVLCVVCAVTDTQKSVYYDPSYGWTVEPDETTEETSLLYLLEEDLSCLSSLDLAEETPRLLGLFGNTLYYITPSDGILRAAGTSDAAQPIAAPLAEVGTFADLTILQEGCAVGLSPAQEEGRLELVVLNISNPSHITRKYLSEPLFSLDSRLNACSVSGGERLLALSSQNTLWLLECSSVFAPELLARMELPSDQFRVLGTETLVCLSGLPGSLLLLRQSLTQP